MSRARWKRTRATVEFCHRRRTHRDRTRISPRERFRYAITLSYPAQGDLYLTDVLSNKPLKEGAHVTVQYDPLDPRRNSLNHPRRERKAFAIVLAIAAPIVLILLVVALFGL